MMRLPLALFNSSTKGRMFTGAGFSAVPRLIRIEVTWRERSLRPSFVLSEDHLPRADFP